MSRDAPAAPPGAGERYTRFERAKIIGARALQVSLGAPVLIDIPDTDPLEISIREFEAGVIPITVRRHS
ncbi:MAG: DNA-directed RNA polymerase subunit K [Halobacteria archaeon]